MSEINSPLGRRRMASSASQVFNVPDETEIVTEPQFPVRTVPEDFDVARKAAVETRKRVSPAAKERIEFLMNLGRTKKDVVFEDVTFSLKSLKSGEMQEVLLAGSKGETRAEAMFEIRNHTLAYALDKIDGQTIQTVLGEDSLDARLNLLIGMDEDLVSYLHDQFNEMVKENKSKFSIKTEEEAKEVVEDLKK